MRFVGLLSVLLCSLAHADITTTVIDVGAGLCTITQFPNGDTMVYDAGRGSSCRNGIQQVVSGNTIDLIIISHNDADHYGGLQSILSAFDVDRLVWTGFPRWDRTTWRGAVISIAAETGMDVIDLGDGESVVGRRFTFGQAHVDIVYGLPFWDDAAHVPDTGPAPPSLGDSERRNVISIVAKLTFQGNSILFAGDTVGKEIGQDQCFYAEREMVNGSVSLDSDVLIAPHHGADNASANCFIQAVSPDFVIFPAGSNDTFGHPRQDTANRYIAADANTQLFRTDLGDDESRTDHWEDGTTVAGCNDPSGDDDVRIVLPASGGTPTVAYVTSSSAGSC